MDVGAFVQENKRWLIGCAIGVLVYLIASVVIGSIYDPKPDRDRAYQVTKTKPEVYDQATLAAAREEGEQLQKERKRLQDELAFVPSAKYRLEGHGSPAEYLFQVGRTLKQSIIDGANERYVQIADKDVSWSAKNGVEEIRGVLFGLELLDEAAQRLFAAHDAVRAADPEAMGLRAILQWKTDDKTGQRAQMRGGRPGEVVLSDYVVQERIQFQFQSDAAVAVAFLEACRKPGRTLTIESVQMTQPQRAGDPVLVKGTLQGIAFKEPQ